MTSPSDQTDTPFRRTLVHLAGDLLSLEPGDRLPAGEEYTERLGVGAGTFAKAVRALTRTGAVELEPRGFRGTFVLSRNLGALWAAAEHAPLRIAFTRPGERDHYGLAIGCMEELRRVGVPAVAVFSPSGATRAQWVADGTADIAVMSSGAAHSVGADPGFDVVEMPSAQYYGKSQLVVVARPGAGDEPEVRVGIDHSSPDHTALTQAALGQVPGARFVECPFGEIPASILRGTVDLGVWHRVEAPISPEVAGLEVRPWRATTMSSTPTAALVMRAGDGLTRGVVDCLDADRVAAVQAEVMATCDLDAIRARLWVA